MSAPVALDAARRGFKTFLLEPNTNVPLIPNWRDVATTDPDQIRGCWALCPNANIGISTENLLTLRITERCPPATVAQLALLFQEHGVPKSVRTQRAISDTGIEILCTFRCPLAQRSRREATCSLRASTSYPIRISLSDPARCWTGTRAALLTTSRCRRRHPG